MMRKAKSFFGPIVLLLFTLFLCAVNLSCAAEPSSAVDTTACEQALFDTVNEYRQSNGKEPLSRNAYIDGLCRQHAQYMASQGALSFDNSKSRSSSIYANVPGMSTSAENVMRSSHSPCDAEHMSPTWFASAPHRTRILDAAYTISGMGIVIDKKGSVWVCQIFAGP